MSRSDFAKMKTAEAQAGKTTLKFMGLTQLGNCLRLWKIHFQPWKLATYLTKRRHDLLFYSLLKGFNSAPQRFTLLLRIPIMNSILPILRNTLISTAAITEEGSPRYMYQKVS